MAFDYGSIDLGLKNPFKKEGVATAIRGLIQSALGIYLLTDAIGYIQTSKVAGWLFVIFGVFLLGVGFKALGSGIFATLRYFVGRNHPTSLAYNHSPSESSTAAEEKGSLAYSQKTLKEMLVGRKNSSFIEPIGFLARLLHSLVPKLLFMPYPIRNLVQRLFGAWVKTLIALISYGCVAFISLTGLVGIAGEVTFPIYSVALLFYVIAVWRSASRPLTRNAELNIESLGSSTIVKVVTWSLILPAVVAVGLTWWVDNSNMAWSDIAELQSYLPTLHTYLYLIALFVISTIGTGLVGVMLLKRLKHANPSTTVSELRENWQESVHPNEIFINLDNLVMADRRYAEVPNRVYEALTPELNEQAEGKGTFHGSLIQEIQPKFKSMDLGRDFSIVRILTLVTGNALFVVSSLLTFALAYAALDVYNAGSNMANSSLERFVNDSDFLSFSELLMYALHLILIGMVVKSFARLLTNAVHIFFAEMQFESLMIYFKCEGTFKESKFSAGTGIHDSIRSENTLIQSSITPWIIVTRIVSTTFAATGIRNLEHPRYILEMHKDDQELASIKNDVVSFLKDRESLSAITNERDLGSASQIYQLNQQNRAFDPEAQRQPTAIRKEEETAGFLRQRDENTPVE
ncbi:hypothetical protein [Marinomonas algarum]|uniref:Uncharacterized protein n=1 Tax=Marinomonas algarum TaxID=2883105 RepID=A0A9X1LFM1_9GAMM|nr:hypothetical protein [Marinomonas algarum]MCB5163083.1 hypothetical protein [Marinomonas algarum]